MNVPELSEYRVYWFNSPEKKFAIYSLPDSGYISLYPHTFVSLLNAFISVLLQESGESSFSFTI